MTMHTGQKHPHAKYNKPLESKSNLDYTKLRNCYVAVSSNTVALLLYECDSSETYYVDELFVWNWRTGCKLFVSFFSHKSLSGRELPTLSLGEEDDRISGHKARQ